MIVDDFETMTTAQLKAEVTRNERDLNHLDRLHAAALQSRDLARMEELDALRRRSLDLATMTRGHLFKRGAGGYSAATG